MPTRLAWGGGCSIEPVGGQLGRGSCVNGEEGGKWVEGETRIDGRTGTFSGKLSLALLPLNRSAASSYALAAASAVSKVPNHTRAAFCGSLISAAHFPHGLCLTPLYFLLLSCLPPWVLLELVVELVVAVVTACVVAAGIVVILVRGLLQVVSSFTTINK